MGRKIASVNRMKDVLLWLGVALVGSGAAMVSLLFTTIWGLRRHNRLHPRVRGHAPLIWLGSPSAAARLHRRLRATVRATRAGGRNELIEALHRAALDIDAQLTVAARLPLPERRLRMAQLAEQTAQVERSARRIVELRGGGRRSDGLAELDERLTMLEAAHRELRTVDVLRAPQRTAAPALDRG